MLGGFCEVMDSAPVAAFAKGPDGRYVYANPYMLASLGQQMGGDWYGKRDREMWPPTAAATIRAHDEACLAGGGLQLFSYVMRLPDGAHTVLLVEFPIQTDEGMGIAGVGVDLTKNAKTEAERDQLFSAIEQATESVMTVDLDSRITYVNPAFERVTGYSRAEVMGENPRLLKSGAQTPWFYDAMWASISMGLPWVADFINRRKDGSLFTEEATISPIRDAAGTVTSYMAIKRDVTQERAMAERSAQISRERALIGEAIRNLRAGDAPEATAQTICRQVINLTGISAANFSLFELDGRLAAIGFAVQGEPDPPLLRISAVRSRHLLERAAEGPWIEPWVERPGHPYNQLMSHLRAQTIGYVPVRHAQRLIGLFVVQGPATGAEILEILPAVVEFADLAGALIDRDVAGRNEAERVRGHISRIIDEGAFAPVFQPIVHLGLDSIVGYEALTRFKDGTDPEVAFAEAASVGLGAELEAATLRAALTAAESLPQSAWLNVNASPELILAGEPLRSLVRGSRRPLVLEVTEHAAIADYPAFRAAMAAFGPSVRFAIDDAGAGFASLRHILELRPAFVKLDRWLVSGIETDEARKAMIVGLRHFSRETGCQLIAEGIETDREFATLRSLDISLGQGYLLGRPKAAAPVEPASGRSPRELVAAAGESRGRK